MKMKVDRTGCFDCARSQRASASLLQRRLRIGYPRAARLLDQLEEMGIVGPDKVAVGKGCDAVRRG